MSSDLPESGFQSGAVTDEAARWVWRRDRGLTPTEQDEFSQWLAADPRHGAEFARLHKHWQRAYGAAEWRPEHGQPNPDLLAPANLPKVRSRRRRRMAWITAASLPLAAAIAIGLFVRRSLPSPPAARPDAADSSAALVSAIEQRTLEDGSLVELNRGSIASVQFTPAERRITLERGEAHFTVQKDPNRPFIVTANGVSVRAVGTAFDVRLDPTAVEVLVTEGRVQIGNPMKSPEIPIVEAGQRAIVSLGSAAPLPQVSNVSSEEIDRFLTWQPRMLDFTAAPLSAIVDEFNRHNPVKLVVGEPAIGALKISATFPSDNVDGFVRLLEAGFNIRAERRGEMEIVLRRAP